MLPDIQAGLVMLAKAIATKASPSGDRTLTISVAPSFASKWLVPIADVL